MVNRLKPLNVMDFTGGVNLRPETFQLAENELPDMLNLEVDPRGGINVRHRWVTLGGAVGNVPASGWDPRNAYQLVTSQGNRLLTLAVADGANGRLLARNEAGTWIYSDNTNPGGDPHIADFASWGEVIYAARGRNPTTVYDGAVLTPLAASATGAWQDDYTAPGLTDTAPAAGLIAAHVGYMFVAGTTEDDIGYPNRVRWSHPNNPRRYAQSDFIDIDEGGVKITALIPFADRLLIFKTDSVWALFGYDADTWELTNVARTVGCIHRQAICRSEEAAFFVSWPDGVFAYTQRGIAETSTQIREVFRSGTHIDPTSLDQMWLGWVDRRLWCSLPYSPEAPITDDASMVFVFDPLLGSWTMFQGDQGRVPGPYIERVEADMADPHVAILRQAPYRVRLTEDTSTATDVFGGLAAPFPTRLRTRWLDAGAPTWKKSWRRPDFLLRSIRSDVAINVRVFHDFDSYNAQRSFAVTYTPDNPTAMWGGFVWGDGTLYGGSEQTSSVERGGTMGRAGTVQIEINGEPGASWGLNGIVFKMIPRRFR